MITELACCHVYLIEGWPLDSVTCPRCYRLRPVVAIECREWKVTCYGCRYGKWCGQSQGLALDLVSAHVRKHAHQVTADYLMHPDSLKKLKQTYKGVKPRIIGDRTIWEYTPEIDPPECAMCGLRAECRCVPF